MEKQKLVAISDIHGRYKALEAILEKLEIVKFRGKWENFNNYKVVFLGDIADHGEGANKSSFKALNIVRELQRDINCTILMSNHLDKLKRWFNGNKVQLTNGLDNTVKEFNDFFKRNEWGESLIEGFKYSWYLWLESLPLYYHHVEDDKSYILAHAYFDDKLWKSTVEPYFCNTKKEYDWFKARCIYGLQKKVDANGEQARRLWWLEEGYAEEHFKENHYITGHVHTSYQGYNHTIIDTDKSAVLYYIPSENIIEEISNE